jgi:hypothetical protein
MKLPRWLVAGLLGASLLSALGVGVWWWVTWPGRTARVLVQAVASHDEAAWKALTGQGNSVWWQISTHAYTQGRVPEPVDRSLMDLLMGRQTFRTPDGWGFSAVRGVIVPPVPPSDADATWKELIEVDRAKVEGAKAQYERAVVEYELRKIEAERQRMKADADRLKWKVP